MKNNRIITQLSYDGATRWVKHVASATLAVTAFALFAGSIAESFFRFSHAEEVQIGTIVGSGFVQITDGACSAANAANQPAYDAVNNVLDINVMPGALASNCFGVTVTTDNTLGYSMTIAGPTTGNLTLAGQSITQKDGTMETPTAFAAQTYGGAWGFAIPSGQIQSGNSGFDASYSVLPRDNTVNTAKYAPVPTSPTTLDTVPSISGTQSFDYDVFFATSAGAYAPTGTYTGTVTISAFGNAAIPPTPEITNIGNTIATTYGTTSGAVTITTDIDATCKWNRNADFTYSTDGTAFTTTGGTIHSTTVTGLQGGNNTIYVRCANAVETSIVSEVSTTGKTISTTPPVATTGANMQEITATTCPTTRTRVRDARDGATYWVRKVGSLCWMETNLAYAGGGMNTFGDVTPMITQGSSSVDYTYTAARYFIPSGSNRTTGTTNPSTSTTGTGQYGYLYNWCAAMNGQSAACQSSTVSQPNQGVNGGTSATQYNICPANWRLPTGGSGGEFESMNMAINSGSTSSDSGLRTAGLFMYSGIFNNGGRLVGQGSSAQYWSSTIVNADNAYYLALESAYVNPATNNTKATGMAVRCVAP